MSVDKQVAAALYYPADEGRMRKMATFFWYRERDNFENYQAYFIFTLEKFSLVFIYQKH